MEAQIHLLEQEAYSAVLRAFKAQSDALTWVCTIGSLHVLFVIFPVLKIHLLYFILCIYQEKEGLITELRKELRVSDDEHRELLTRVNSDEIIHRIRFGNYLNSCNSSEKHYFWPFFSFYYVM